MSVRHDNIAALRALGNQLKHEGDAAKGTGTLNTGRPGVELVWLNAAMLEHLHRACIGAAVDLEEQERATIEKTLGAAPVASA